MGVQEVLAVLVRRAGKVSKDCQRLCPTPSAIIETNSSIHLLVLLFTKPSILHRCVSQRHRLRSKESDGKKNRIGVRERSRRSWLVASKRTGLGQESQGCELSVGPLPDGALSAYRIS